MKAQKRQTTFWKWQNGFYVVFVLQKYIAKTVAKFNEFKPSLKSAKNRFQLSAGLNLETLNTILSETNHI